MCDQNLIIIAKTIFYKHCGDVCNNAIIMSQFLQVVRQHMLGVVGSVTSFC